MEERLLEDLKTELEIVDTNFNLDLLSIKVKNAILDAKAVRNYPDNYTDEMIESDISKYYSIIRLVALNDYNKVGVDTETSHSENNVSSNFVDRNKLFGGILPLGRI